MSEQIEAQHDDIFDPSESPKPPSSPDYNDEDIQRAEQELAALQQKLDHMRKKKRRREGLPEEDLPEKKAKEVRYFVTWISNWPDWKENGLTSEVSNQGEKMWWFS